MKYLVTWDENNVDPVKVFKTYKEAEKFAKDLVENGNEYPDYGFRSDMYYEPWNSEARKPARRTVQCTNVKIYQVEKMYSVYEKKNIVVEEI